ncbi:MAG: glycine--tRNA ligase [Candidatus Spechtbacterales bacterium]|nr:glycine--tRNA ligase [Candidatus Spechtbacterales bacterium]
MEKNEEKMNKVIALTKRRGFIYPGSEIYGGLANSWDYGPNGTELKNNIKNEWWKRFVQARQDMVGVDAALIMNPKVWEASGHVGGFNDPLVEDKKTHERYRLDHLLEDAGVENAEGMSLEEMTKKVKELKLKSPKGNELTEPKMFNLMFETYLGPIKDEDNKAYLRPETAQAMFVDFKNIIDTTRQRIPFGVAQIGKAFRNEITTGNFIFRLREFEQMEIEYFIKEEDWEEQFEYWLKEMHGWIEHLGLDKKKVRDYEVPKDELAHYSKRTVDIEYEYPFGTKELYGLAYRTDHDLKNHMEHSGQDLRFRDPYTGERYIPHVVEPTFGVDRTVLAVLVESYAEEEVDGDTRVVMKFPRWVAPVKAAVFPLIKKDEGLVKIAKDVYSAIAPNYNTEYDESGAIGKRYRRHDEIGTPICITVDHQALEDKTITLRERDSMEQIRVPADEIGEVLDKYYAGADFLSLGEKV